MIMLLASATEELRGQLRESIGLGANLDTTPAGIVSAVLPLLFTAAGMILFLMLVWGGFEMMINATDSKAQEAGKQRITAAIIGFVLLFCSYWIAQLLQYVFGVTIVG